jgi:hypothetical protein
MSRKKQIRKKRSLYDSNHLPAAGEYFTTDKNGNRILIPEIYIKKSSYKIENGQKFNFYIRDPKRKTKFRRGIYVKVKDKYIRWPISQTREFDGKPTTMCKVSFSTEADSNLLSLNEQIYDVSLKFLNQYFLSDPKSDKANKAKLIGEIKKYANTKNIKLQPWSSNSYNEEMKKKVQNSYRNLLNEMNNYTIGILPIHYNPCKMHIDLIRSRKADYYPEDEKRELEQIKNFSFQSIKILLERKKKNTNKKKPDNYQKGKDIYDNFLDNREIIRSTPTNRYGATITNMTAKTEWKKLEAKYQKASPGERETLASQLGQAKKNYNKTSRIVYRVNNINTYIPAGCLCKFIGFTFIGIFYSKNMWTIQVNLNHLLYTEEIQTLISPDDDEYYKELDEIEDGTTNPELEKKKNDVMDDLEIE